MAEGTGTIAIRDPRTGQWVDKPTRGTHSFFPEEWTRRQTELEIDHAFKNSWPDPDDELLWHGLASDGTQIHGRYVDPLKPWQGWTSAYPVYEGVRVG